MNERTVIKMAKYYVRKKNMTLKKLSDKFDVSLKTINNCFNNDLKFINPKLYGKVQGKKAENINKVRFTKSKKCLFGFFGKKR